MRDFRQYGAAEHTEPSTTGMLSHVFIKYHRHQSYLIGDGQVVALQQPTLCIWIDEYERHPCLLPSRIQHHHQYWHLWPSADISRAWRCLNALTIMPNKSVSGPLHLRRRQRMCHSSAPIYYYGFDKEHFNDFVQSKSLLRSTTGSTLNVHFRGEDLGQIPYPKSLWSPQHHECHSSHWFALHCRILI